MVRYPTMTCLGGLAAVDTDRGHGVLRTARAGLGASSEPQEAVSFRVCAGDRTWQQPMPEGMARTVLRDNRYCGRTATGVDVWPVMVPYDMRHFLAVHASLRQRHESRRGSHHAGAKSPG